MDEWHYHPPPDIDATVTERLRNFPRQPYMLVCALRSLAALLLRGWMRLYHRLRIEGREHLPAQGSYVLVCNHTSHLDTLCLLCAVPIGQIHRAFPAAAADYFFCSLPRSAVSAVLINALPFDRQLRGAQSLAVCAGLLENPGNILILFPEGTRTTTGEMGRFRSGIGRLLAGKDLPVLPCHLSGGWAAWPKGRALPLPRKLRLRIGPPENYADYPPQADSVRQICEELQACVARLGEEDT